jgi:transposase-like protein
MTRAQACAVNDGAVPSNVSRRPLCRHYVLGFFDTAVVRWRDAQAFHDLPIHWAFGWLADGECEPLGVWIEPDAASEGPLRLLTDLKARGLERIRHVAGTDTARLREHAAAAFSSAGRGSSAERIVAQVSAASRRHVPASLERSAEEVGEALARAIRRRGSFASRVAALDFVSGALQRMERRLDRERAIAKVRPRHESGAQMVPPGF